MAESNKTQEIARKKVTRKANPQEAYPRAPFSPVESDEALEAKTGKGVVGPNEALANGFSHMDFDDDLDVFDNERNYNRVCPQMGSVHEIPEERAYNKIQPTPGYGPKEKRVDQDGEDYGKSSIKESDHQDD